MHPYRHALAPAILSLALALPAAAGVSITVDSTSPGSPKPETMTLKVEADRMRADSAEGAFIYRADRKVIWVLQPAEKSYFELTEQQAEQLGGMMAAVKAQMASLPPEQRAMIEQAMAARMGGQAPAGMAGMMGSASTKPEALEPTTFVPTGKKETINTWACTSFDAQRGGVTTEELWVTPFEAFGVKQADFAVFESLGEFLKKMSGPMAEQLSSQPFLSSFGSGKDFLPGVPVRTLKTTGRGDSVTEVKTVDRGDVPAAQFELPQGWTKQSIGQ